MTIRLEGDIWIFLAGVAAGLLIFVLIDKWKDWRARK